MSTGGSGGDAGITYVLKAIADPTAKKAFDELIGYHKGVAAAQSRLADQAASHREASVKRIQAAEGKALAATLRETERVNDAQRARSRAVTESQISEIQKVTRERQAAADRGIRAISKIAEHIAISEKKAADAAITEAKRAASRVDAERQRGVDRLFAGLSRVAARVAIEEKKQADAAIREAERAAAVKDRLASRAYKHTPFTPGDPAEHAAYVAQQRIDQEQLRAEQARRADARARFESIRQSEMEAARRARRGGPIDAADPSKAVEATRALERAQERLASRVQVGAGAVARLLGGFAELGLAGEKNTEDILRGLIKINAAIDLFSGGITLIRSIVSGYDAWTKATLATAAAHEALAGARASAGAAGAAGSVGGSVAAGGAAGSAAAVLGIAAAATAVVGSLVLLKEHLDGTSARMGGLSGTLAPMGQSLGEMRYRANRALGSDGGESLTDYKQSVESAERYNRSLTSTQRRRQERRDAESMSESRERIEGSAVANARMYAIGQRRSLRDLMRPELREKATQRDIDVQRKMRMDSLNTAAGETNAVLFNLKQRAAGNAAFGKEGTGASLTGNALAANLEDQKAAQESLLELEKERIDAVRDWASASKRAVDDQISGLQEALRIEKEKADTAREKVDSSAAAFGRLDPFEQQKAAEAFKKYQAGGALDRQEADAIRGIGFGEEADAADAARARGNKDFAAIDAELRNRATEAEKKVAKIELDIKTQEEIKLAITVKAEAQIQEIARGMKPIIDEIGKNFDKAIAQAFEQFNREIADRDLSRMPGA